MNEYPFPGYEVRKDESEKEYIKRMIKKHPYNPRLDTGNVSVLLEVYPNLIYKENKALTRIYYGE